MSADQIGDPQIILVKQVTNFVSALTLYGCELFVHCSVLTNMPPHLRHVAMK
jgi:hypothetical protein